MIIAFVAIKNNGRKAGAHWPLSRIVVREYIFYDSFLLSEAIVQGNQEVQC